MSTEETFNQEWRPTHPDDVPVPRPEPRTETFRERPPTYGAGHMGPPRMAEAPKDTGVAWLLWFFLGGFGGHNFYLRKPGAATTQLIFTLVGLVTSFFVIGVFLLVPVAIWWIVDAFLINGRVREINAGILGAWQRPGPAGR